MQAWKHHRWGNHRKPQQREGESMARIIVTTDQREQSDAPVLLDEHVCAEHLSDGHAAAQLMQRLGWAVNDAEHSEREPLGGATAR
jgi:hypothetical protein